MIKLAASISAFFFICYLVILVFGTAMAIIFETLPR